MKEDGDDGPQPDNDDNGLRLEPSEGGVGFKRAAKMRPPSPSKVLLFGTEPDPVWGEVNKPFIGFKIASVTLKKNIKTGVTPKKPEEQAAYEPELGGIKEVEAASGEKPKW